jgi:hypothetical protein
VTPTRRARLPRRVTPELLAFYTRRAHQLRAEAYVNTGHALWTFLKRIIRPR